MYSLKPEVDRLYIARGYVHFHIFLIGVALIVGVLSIFIFSFLSILVGLALFFAVLFSFLFLLANNRLLSTRFNCPNCGKHIPAFDPWMCPTCNEIDDVPARIKEYEAVVARNKALSRGAKKEKEYQQFAYGFIYECPTCSSRATTFKCHSCGEVLALTDNPDPERFAYNPLLLPDGVWVDEDLKSKVDKIKREEESEHQEIRDAERKFDVKDKLFDLEKKREEHYKRKVDDGLMSEKEAQKNLKKDRLYIERRRTLG